jgi:hypothetical protein
MESQDDGMVLDPSEDVESYKQILKWCLTVILMAKERGVLLQKATTTPVVAEGNYRYIIGTTDQAIQ